MTLYCLFIHSFTKYLLSINYVGTCDTLMSKIVIALNELLFLGGGYIKGSIMG